MIRISSIGFVFAALSTIVTVQRLLAALVLSVIGFLPVAPVLASFSATAKNLPACCRAHGKHKCAMRGMENAPASPAAELAMYGVCGEYPFSTAMSYAQESATVFPPKATELSFEAIVSHPIEQTQTEARYRISFARSRQKRGPPTFLS